MIPASPGLRDSTKAEESDEHDLNPNADRWNRLTRANIFAIGTDDLFVN